MGVHHVAEAEAVQQQEAPVCEVFCYDPDKVERLKGVVSEAQGLAPLFKALADDTRVGICCALAGEELCVCDVAHIMGCSVATASHHLRILRDLGLVKYRRAGKLVFYSLDDNHVVQLIAAAREHRKERRP